VRYHDLNLLALGVSIEKNTITISCMDARCTSHEREGALKLRRAGGFVGGRNLKPYMPTLLRENGSKRMDIELHEDCGAIKLVSRGVERRQEVDDQTYDAIISPFLKHSTNPATVLGRIYDIAREIQIRVALEWKNNGTPLRKVYSMRRAVHGHVEGDKALLLTTPTRAMFADVLRSIDLKPESTYVITLVPGNVRHMAIDPQIAVRYLGIRNVFVYPSGGGSDSTLNKFWSAYRRGEIYLHGANVKRL